ncbi:hypothetical protein Pcac1_g28814 [Phytophthora cactorum]|nr:hypothetical protein Pcac1_g28814 [Phytophthora cactorum]
MVKFEGTAADPPVTPPLARTSAASASTLDASPFGRGMFTSSYLDAPVDGSNVTVL